MKALLPTRKKTDQVPPTELLPTHKSFFRSYGILLILGILILSVALISFGGIIFQKSQELVANKNRAENQEIQPTPQTPKYSEFTIETGYKLQKDKEWEIVTIVSEPEQVELIASSKFNATRVEITSYSKTYPTWEEKVGLNYFEVESTESKTISGEDVTIVKGRDESLYARAATFNNDDKILEIRVFSASEKYLDEIFNTVTQSVIVL
jgi:hypothetical protein